MPFQNAVKGLLMSVTFDDAVPLQGALAFTTVKSSVHEVTVTKTVVSPFVAKLN